MQPRLDTAQVMPDGMKAFGSVHAYLHSHTDLGKDLIDLVFLRTSQINGCAYCIDMHSRDLLAMGLPVEKLVLVPVWHEADEVFDERERAALAWCEIVTNVATSHVPDADYAAVSEVFSDKDRADLTAAISLMNAYNRLGVAFRMKPKGGA